MIRGLMAAACSRVSGAPAATGVQYIAMSEGAFVTSSSSTVSTPAGVQSADALLCVLMHRSTVTPPSGWALLATRDVLGAEQPDHAVSVYRMTSPSSGAYTWSQAASARMKVVYVVARNNYGLVVFSSSASSNKTDQSNTLHSMPPVTAIVDGELHLQCSTCVYASGGVYTKPASSIEITGGAVNADNRLGVAYAKPATGQQSGGSFTHANTDGSNPSSHDGAELTLVFSPGA